MDIQGYLVVETTTYANHHNYIVFISHRFWFQNIFVDACIYA